MARKTVHCNWISGALLYRVHTVSALFSDDGPWAVRGGDEVVYKRMKLGAYRMSVLNLELNSIVVRSLHNREVQRSREDLLRAEGEIL